MNNQCSKEQAKEEIAQLLQSIKQTKTTVVFTDGSSLGNPGPTGCSAVIYEHWGRTEPYTVKKPVAAKSNNYEGELQGLHLALSTLSKRERSEERVLILCDCKAAIENVITTHQVDAYNDLVNNIRQKLHEMKQKRVNIQIEWCPGHMGVAGNELADEQAKLAAEEARNSNMNTVWTRQQALKHIEKQAEERWKRRSELHTTSKHMQKINVQMKKKCKVLGLRSTQIAINQLVSGHTSLNAYRNWIDDTESPNCEACGERESTEHFLYYCPRYETSRHRMYNEVDNIYQELSTREKERRLDIVTLAGMREDLGEETNKMMYKAFSKYIEDTGRFAGED
ncbi:uncharacterized protein LOC118430208 [Branchiostoma floridae]|uniref:Uncharacterized protein LOC118430208 n=1 Tax=Branchiostoma floridae TaxID=7739 RepID=A0A9J7NBS5_BRAFL|nr:uncharacterized protein LOC118430208 [Branchiostoma floridae]